MPYLVQSTQKSLSPSIVTSYERAFTAACCTKFFDQSLVALVYGYKHFEDSSMHVHLAKQRCRLLLGPLTSITITSEFIVPGMIPHCGVALKSDQKI